MGFAMDDLLTEFVAETREMLAASQAELIAWEADPSDHTRLDAIFRMVHTVKGNCGFFDFPRLETLSHAAESVLADIRSERRCADAALVDAVLAVIDRIGMLADMIEAGDDLALGASDDSPLLDALGSSDTQSAPETHPNAHAKTPLLELAEKTDASAAPTAIRSVRLPVDLLDRVMNGVSDMVLARNDLARRLREGDGGAHAAAMAHAFDHLTGILTDVREAVTNMRMQRIGHLFGALPRLVRDLSADLDKRVLVEINGDDVELDREMIESIRDPLTHIIRNAIDHGIEMPADRVKAGKQAAGLLTISAWQSGNKITIMVSDDGHGLNEDAIGAKAVANGMLTADAIKAMPRDDILQLIFEPGLTTKAVANSISGRGVGMDVVRSNLERVGGSIRTISAPGEGTRFALEVPLTLGIVTALTVGVGSHRFAIPRSYIQELRQHSSGDEDESAFTRVGDSRMAMFRGKRVPVVSLADLLGLTVDPVEECATPGETVVMVRLADGSIFAMTVDTVFDHDDLVIKPLPPALVQAGIYAGTTLREDGCPMLMLDMPAIADRLGLADVNTIRSARRDVTDDIVAQPDAANRVIVAVGFDGRRVAVRMTHLHRIETISAAEVTRDMAQGGMGNGNFASVRGRIVALHGLPPGPLPDKLRCLRLTCGDGDVSYCVATVCDFAAISGAVTRTPGLAGSEGMAIVDGEVTVILDPAALVNDAPVLGIAIGSAGTAARMIGELALLTYIAGHLAAFRAADVRTVIERPAITPVPLTQPHVRGVAALRSKAMTVIDCAAATGCADDRAKDADQMAIVVDLDGHTHALLVDSVRDAVPCLAGPQPMAGDIGAGWRRVTDGMIETDLGPALLIDIRALVKGPNAAVRLPAMQAAGS